MFGVNYFEKHRKHHILMWLCPLNDHILNPKGDVIWINDTSTKNSFLWLSNTNPVRSRDQPFVQYTISVYQRFMPSGKRWALTHPQIRVVLLRPKSLKNTCRKVTQTSVVNMTLMVHNVALKTRRGWLEPCNETQDDRTSCVFIPRVCRF